MNNDQFDFFLGRASKDLWSLIEDINRVNLDFVQSLMCGNSFFCSEHASETNILARLIAAKSKREREEYFISEAKLFCSAYEEDKHELLKELRAELGYFQHCFLHDTKLRRVSLDYSNLKELTQTV